MQEKVNKEIAEKAWLKVLKTELYYNENLIWIILRESVYIKRYIYKILYANVIIYAK